MVQPLAVEDDETPLMMRELLPRGTGGPKTDSSFTGKGSVETATADYEEEESSVRIKRDQRRRSITARHRDRRSVRE